MRPRKYPLDPLARLRAKQVDDAARLLSDAVGARERAELAEKVAVAEQDAAEAAVQSVARPEREALERGRLRAVDLARAAAWEARVDAERTELAGRAAIAADRADAAQASEGSAKDGVARARADAEVVARDWAKWEGAAKKKEESAEEEAAAEAFRGKRR